VATIKAGCLIFTRKGAGTTPGGQLLPLQAIRRKDGDRHRWSRQTRDEQAGMTAYWHDKGARQNASW